MKASAKKLHIQYKVCVRVYVRVACVVVCVCVCQGAIELPGMWYVSASSPLSSIISTLPTMKHTQVCEKPFSFQLICIFIQAAMVASKKDDAVDADKDGVADVKQLAAKEVCYCVYMYHFVCVCVCVSKPCTPLH